MTASTATASSAEWPTTLGGVTVTLTDSQNNSADAQLFYVSPGQINLYVPPKLMAGSVTVQVSGGLNPFQAMLTQSAPAIFTYLSDNVVMPAAQIVAVSADGTVSAAQPIGPITIPSQGELYLVLYGTGIRNHSSSTGVLVTIGNDLAGTYPIQPTYAGAQPVYPGLDQINLPIPAVLAGKGNASVTVYLYQTSGNGAPVQTSNTTFLIFP
jgi:uncharacterized protein (TIGR03437 family)